VSRLVIWAPDASEGIGDAPGSLAPGDWKHLACVEPAFLWDGHEIALPPGGRHQFDFEISVSK
jgi:D-hexose-6-phosphate mutarotase